MCHRKNNRVNQPGPLELSVSEPPTKKHTWTRPRPPCPYIADVQFVLHVGLEQLKARLSQKLLPVRRMCSTR